MKKLMKPIALLFVVAVSTGAYAQQDKPGRAVKAQLKAEKPALVLSENRKMVKTKSFVVPNRDADIKRMVRQKGLTTAEVK